MLEKLHNDIATTNIAESQELKSVASQSIT